MLPTQSSIDIVGNYAGPLSFGIHEKFGSQREVVELVWRVVDVEQERLFVSRAGQRGAISTMRAAGGIERHDLRAEGCAAICNRCGRYRIIQVRHFKFVDIPSLESDVPIIVELVIVRAAKPLQICSPIRRCLSS